MVVKRKDRTHVCKWLKCIIQIGRCFMSNKYDKKKRYKAVGLDCKKAKIFKRCDEYTFHLENVNATGSRIKTTAPPDASDALLSFM